MSIKSHIIDNRDQAVSELYNMEKAMNAIKITEKNFGKISQIIEQAEGKGWANTASLGLILNKIKLIDEKLTQLKIPKKYWDGIEYEYCAGGKKRGWTNTATKVVLRYKNNGWYVINVERNKFHLYKDTVTLTEKAKLAIPTLIHLK